MRVFQTLFWLFILFENYVNGVKFLFYNPVSPGASPSHRLFIDKLSDLLVDAGHDVTSFMPTMIDHNEGQKKRKAKVIAWRSNETINLPETHNNIDVWNMDESFWDIFDQTSGIEMYGYFARLCGVLINNEEIIEKLRKEKFDLGMSENFDPCGFVLFKKLGIKYAPTFSTTPNNFQFEELGIPSPLSFIPSWIAPFTNPASFTQRFINEISDLYSEQVSKYVQIGPIVNRQGLGTYKEILGESQLIFVNSDEYVDFARPTSEKIVYIGGFGLDRVKKISQDEETHRILDNSKRTVLLSFGALVNSSEMPLEVKQSFVEAFAEFPETTFIWRYQTPGDQFAQKFKNIKNVVLQKWVPQMQILSHPNTRAFLSHCGMNSMSEANYFGVPMVCVPFYGDQSRNIKMLEQKGIGIELKKTTINKKNIVKVFSELLNNKQYYEKAQKLSQLIRAKPLGPTDRFIKFAELAARFNLHEVTDLPGRKLNVIQYYNLDVKLVLLNIPILVVFVLYKLLRILFSSSSVSSKKSQKNSKKKNQ